MIIDSHQHVFWHGRDDNGLVRDMDEQKIDRGWLLTWIQHPEENREVYHARLNPLNLRPDGTHSGITLDDLVIARDRFPDRFVLGYCPHPLLGDAPGMFEAAYSMYGVRVCGECKVRVLLDDPRCLNLFRKAGTLKCPVVLHLDVPYLADGKGGWTYDPTWYGGTVDNLERVLQQCPETVFIGHAPGFWRHISGDADADPGRYPRGSIAPGGRLRSLFAKYPNLRADLSAGSALIALQRDRTHAIDFLCEFSDRLLFGRDQYGAEHQQFLASLDLPADVTRKIFAENALRLVG